MSHQKRYTIYLAARHLDGQSTECELRMTPIGSSNTSPDSFWMQQLFNLATGNPTTHLHGVVGSSRIGPADEQEI